MKCDRCGTEMIWMRDEEYDDVIESVMLCPKCSNEQYEEIKI